MSKECCDKYYLSLLTNYGNILLYSTCYSKVYFYTMLGKSFLSFTLLTTVKSFKKSFRQLTEIKFKLKTQINFFDFFFYTYDSTYYSYKKSNNEIYTTIQDQQ